MSLRLKSIGTKLCLLIELNNDAQILTEKVYQREWKDWLIDLVLVDYTYMWIK